MIRRPEVVIAQVRMLASDTSCVVITKHAEERMNQRDINSIEVLRVLRNGRLKGEITNGKCDGEVILTVADQIKGRREAGVVTVVQNGKKLIVVTVEWEDM